MKITLEISMYPLREDYEKQILRFLELIHESQVEIKVNAMSTQVKGEFDEVYTVVNNAIKKIYADGVKACFVSKLLPSELDLTYSYS